MQGSPRIDELRQKFHENPRRYFAPLANEYRKAGDPEQAIAICRAHLAQQPAHMSGHVVYGQALFDANRQEEARVVFEKALVLDPDNAIVLRQLGDIARQKGETAEARHWYTRALEADPQNPQVAAYIAELTEPLTETQTEEPELVEASKPEAEVTKVEDLVPAEQAVAPWRKTPPSEESPFVTRTMAEVYAKQGYRAAALDVYRQLALQHPDDTDIQGRIDELSTEPAPLQAGGDEHGTPQTEEPRMDAGEMAPGPTVPGQSVAEPVASAESDFSPEFQTPSGESFGHAELSDDGASAPASEDLNLAGTDFGADIGVSPVGSQHFTDTELPTADTWDTDSWGAGFSSDEGVDLSFESPDTVLESPAEAGAEAEEPIVADAQAEAEAEMDLDAAGAAPLEAPLVTEEEVAESESLLAAVEDQLPEASEGALTEHFVEPESTPEPESTSEPDWTAALEPVAPQSAEQPEAVTEDDESQLVAYSPQLPEDEDLPHYTPKGPTVREFFATLGARRPPDHEPRASITAHAPVAGMEHSWNSEPEEPAQQVTSAEENVEGLPLANDTFSSLFPDAPVLEEDTRAAFALSGAVAAPPVTQSEPVRKTPPRTAEAVASPAPAQESEEDIRRFREWLDGLAES